MFISLDLAKPKLNSSLRRMVVLPHIRPGFAAEAAHEKTPSNPCIMTREG